ncbi:MAG TPA: 2OG-Fe(II) oxygenase family protein [Acidimicrobiales bacterium]|nr:2OG-Fe(II) oxygenase family protein [Acidimicrobiales bacterium]
MLKDQIPVIDLNSADSDKLLDETWREIGFACIIGHQIDPNLFVSMRSLLKRLFALSDEIKAQYLVSPDNYRGFIPLGFFTPNRKEITGTGADAYEAFKLHWECPPEHPVRNECSLYGSNRWVEDLDDMGDIISAYWDACDVLAGDLLASVAKSLKIDFEFLNSTFQAPLTNMTLLRYPSTPQEFEFGIHPHKDTNIFTLLHPDQNGGLEIKSPDGSWVEINCPEDALVINTGEMLELWSGGYYTATAHRVINRGSDRYTFPYFMVPNHKVVIEPLVPTINGFKNSVMPVGELTAEVWRTNWPEEKPNDHEFDLGSLS